MENRIKNKYYDKIIYGTAWSSLPYLDELCSVYDKIDIIFLDGTENVLSFLIPIKVVNKLIIRGETKII